MFKKFSMNNKVNIKNLINPKNTALIVIDIQNDYCSEKGKIAKIRKLNVAPIQKIIPKIIKFTKISKEYAVPIIYTRMIENAEHMKKNAILKKMTSKIYLDLCIPGTWGFEYYKIKPLKNDAEIIKKSYDSFSNPKLETILKKGKIKNLIIIGVYTSICVDTTIRTAFTKGYNIVVPEDLVSMPEERINQHNASIDIWKKIFAHVTISDKIIEDWKMLKN